MRIVAIVALALCSSCALVKGRPFVTDISSRNAPGRAPTWTGFIPCGFQRDTSRVRAAVDSACLGRRDTLSPSGDPQRTPGERLP